MSKYIDADEALEQIRKKLGVKSLDYLLEAERQIVAVIQSMPSIDIVRCKECTHWYRALDESGTIERFNFSRCTKGHSGNGLEFYCADGKREGE